MSYPKTSTAAADAIKAESSLAVGCKVVNGKITPALSVLKNITDCPQNVAWAARSAAAGVSFAYADGTVYGVSDGGGAFGLAELGGDSPFMFERRTENGGTAYVVGDGKCLEYGKNSFTEKAFKSNIYAGVIKNGRLFCADKTQKTKLLWSGGDGAFDWTEGINGAGWAYLSPELGDILNLVVWNEKLVAVREYGLSVISAYGTPENFKQTEGFSVTQKIYKNTVAEVRGKLYFYMRGALACFDGAKITVVENTFANCVHNPEYAAVYGENYLVCGYINRLARRGILVYNPAENSAYAVDFAASALCAGNGVLAFGESGGAVLDEGGDFTFISGQLNFSTPAKKTLNRLEVMGEGEVDVVVSNGVKSRIFKGVSGAIRPDLRGKNFTVQVRGVNQIQKITVYAEVL